MGFELEKRLATELNRLAEDQGDERDHAVKKPQKQIERIKRIAAELKERLLGGVAEEDVPGKRSGVDEAMSAAVRKLEENVRRITSFDALPWQQKASFDSFRERGLREVLDAVGDRKLRAATVAAADKTVAGRTGEKAGAKPSPAGQAMWRAAERRAATLYRHAQEAGEVASEDPVVDEALTRAGSGHALPADVRKQMERELGISLARVRVHTDPVAAAAAKAVKASAFTVGEDIFFAHNAFAPDTREGKKLLAHELTHVVQAYQGRTHSGGAGITVSQPGEGLEREADAMAERVERKTTRKTTPRRGAQPKLAEPTAVRSSGKGKSAHVLRQQADATGANNQDEHDPNKGVKPKLTFVRDHAKDQAQKHSIAGPVKRMKGAAQQLSQQLNAVTKGPISELKSTAKQLRAKPPGHDAKNEHKAHQKHHEHHHNEAKHAAKQAKEHARHAKDAAKHHKPEHHAPAKDTTGTGPIHFKPVSDWSKYMPEPLPNQDARERKRILGLVQKSVNEDRKESSKLLNQLRVAQVKQAASVRGMLPGLQATIRGGQSAALGRVSAAEASQTSAVKAAVAGQQAAVRSTAAAMVGQINTAHAAAKAEIKAAHQAAVQFLQQSKDKAIQDIAQACQTECTTVHNLYEDCKNRVIALGAAKAGEAHGVPATVSLPYSGDKLDAAKKAAQDVANQYAEAMPGEASDAAGKIGQSEPDAITQIEKIATDNQKQLEEAFTQAKDALDQSMEQANKACDQIKEQAVSQVNSTASTTVSQLAALGASQVAAIQQQAAGARQGIQSAGAAALQSVASGVSNAASGIEKGAHGLIKGAKQIEAPNAEETKKQVQESAAQLAQGTKQIGAGLTKSASGAVTGMNGQAQSAAGGMAQTATAAKQSATQKGQEASRAITQIGQASSDSLKQLSGNYKTSADDMAKKADESFKKVVEGTKKAYDGITNQVTTNLNGAYTNVQSSFDAAVPAKEREDILANAKKAADAVKPWWQKALAFVASVVVAIVVSVVVVALIVTTGPVGAILVGAAAGALGSVAGQMASNLILGNGLMDGVTWQSVALGAVGGAVGAGFSQGVTAGARALSAGGSRFASAGARVVTAMGEGSSGLGNFAIKTGIGVAGDQVSDVASQLIVTGHYEFSMENLATSLVTNGITSTKKYGEIEHAVQGGLQNHIGHVEIGGANGAVSVHGPGSPVPEQGHVGSATGAPQGSSAPAAGHGGAHGDAPGAGAHPSGPSGAGPSGAHPTGAHPEGGTGSHPSGPSGSHPSGPEGGTPRTTTGNEPHGSQPRGEQTAQGGAPRENQPHQQGGSTHNDPHGTKNEPHGTQGHDQTAHGNEPHGNEPHGAQPHGPEGTPAHGQNDPHGQHDPAAHPQDAKNAHGQNDPHGQQPKAGGDHETAPHGGEHDNAAHGDEHDNAAHGGDHDNAHGDNSTAHAGGDDANAHAGPESESAGELADMGYPNATHQKAEQAAGAIEGGSKPSPDSVRDTEANQRGLHELDKVNTDATLSNESKQNIRRDVADHMRGEEPTGVLDRDVKQARAHEEEATGKNKKLGVDEFAALPPAEQMHVAGTEIAEGAHTFPSQDAAAKWARDNLQHEVESLPGHEKQSIHNYTNEPGHKGHTGPTYKEMNSVLRADASGHASPHDSPAVRQDIAQIDAAMNKNRLPEAVTVVRGTGHSHLDATHPSELVGQTLTDHAYMSTSLGDNGAVAAFKDKEMILHLQVPAGHPALWVEPVGAFGGGERELLLGRGTQYEITRAFIGPDGKWHAYGHVLGGGSAPKKGSPAPAPGTKAPSGAAPTAPTAPSGGGSTAGPSSAGPSGATGGGTGFGEGEGTHQIQARGEGKGDGQPGGDAEQAQATGGITTQTAATAPGNKSDTRRDVGVGELVYFTSPSKGKWSATAGTKSGTGDTFNWNAPDTAQSVTVTFTPATGTAEMVTMNVVAPTMKLGEITSLDKFKDGVAGAGFVAKVVFEPLNVSFQFTSWFEDTGQKGTNPSGYFQGKTLPVHKADPNWHTIGADNSGPTDHPSFSEFAAPWTAGSFQWDIQQNYRVGSGSLHKMNILSQVCTLAGPPSAGRVTVSKGGQSTSRDANGAVPKKENTESASPEEKSSSSDDVVGMGTGEGAPAGAAPAGAAGGGKVDEVKYSYPDSEKDDAAIKKVEDAVKARFPESAKKGLEDSSKEAPIKEEEMRAKMAEAKAQEAQAAKDQPDEAKKDPPPALGSPAKANVQAPHPPAPAKADEKKAGGKGGGEDKKGGKAGGHEHAGGAHAVPAAPTPIVLRAAEMGPAEVEGYLNSYPSKSPETTEKLSKIKEMSKVAQGFDGQVEGYIAQNSGVIAGAQAKLIDFLGKKEISAIFSHNPYEKVEGGLGKLMRALSTINSIVTIVGNVCTKLGMVLTVVGLLGMIFPPLGAAVSAVARVLNVVGLVCDVLGLALNGVLTGLNGMQLARLAAKPGASPEEKAATADMMVQEATSAGGHVINLAMHYGPKFMKGFKSASKGVIGSLFAKVKSTLGKWGTKALGPAANWAKNIGYKLGFGLKPGSGAVGKFAKAAWKSPGTLLEKVRETSLVRKINNSGFMQGLERKSVGINAFMDGKGGFLSKATNVFENGSEKVGGLMGSGIDKGSNAIAHKINANWKDALEKSVENDEKAIATAAEKHAAANAANRETAAIDRDIAKERKLGQKKFDEAFNPEDASVDRKLADQGTAHFENADKIQEGKAGAVSAAEKEGAEKKAAQLEQKKEASEAKEAKEKKEERQIDEFKKDPAKFQDTTERFQHQQERLEEKLKDQNLPAKERKELEEKAEKFKEIVADRQTIGAKASGAESPENLWQAKHAYKEGKEALHGQNERMEWMKEGQEKTVDAHSGHKFHEEAEKEERRKIIGELQHEAHEAPAPTTSEQVEGMLAGLDDELGLGADEGHEGDAHDHGGGDVDVVAGADAGADTAPQHGDESAAAKEPQPQPQPQPQPAGDQAKKDEQLPEIPELVYWPKLAGQGGDFAQAAADLHRMKQVAYGFYKAQAEAKKKAEETAYGLGYSAKKAEEKQQAAQQHAASANAVSADAGKSAGAAAAATGETTKGEGAQNNSKKSADGSAQEAPDPGEKPSRWHPIKRIWWYVKKWAADKAAKVFGWIQEKIANLVLNAICGVSMGDMKAYTTALHHRMQFGQKTGAQAADASHKANEEAGKTKQTAKDDAAQAMDDAKECDRNMADADSFIKSVEAAEQDMIAEQARAGSFLTSLYAALQEEKRRKQEEAQKAALANAPAGSATAAWAAQGAAKGAAQGGAQGGATAAKPAAAAKPKGPKPLTSGAIGKVQGAAGYVAKQANLIVEQLTTARAEQQARLLGKIKDHKQKPGELPTFLTVAQNQDIGKSVVDEAKKSTAPVVAAMDTIRGSTPTAAQELKGQAGTVKAQAKSVDEMSLQGHDALNAAFKAAYATIAKHA